MVSGQFIAPAVERMGVGGCVCVCVLGVMVSSVFVLLCLQTFVFKFNRALTTPQHTHTLLF